MRFNYISFCVIRLPRFVRFLWLNPVQLIFIFLKIYYLFFTGILFITTKRRRADKIIKAAKINLAVTNNNQVAFFKNVQSCWEELVVYLNLNKPITITSHFEAKFYSYRSIQIFNVCNSDHKIFVNLSPNKHWLKGAVKIILQFF